MEQLLARDPLQQPQDKEGSLIDADIGAYYTWINQFREFHRRIWAGEVNLADYDLQIVNGMGETATKLLRDKLKSVASTH